jgi:hypothetical protein
MKEQFEKKIPNNTGLIPLTAVPLKMLKINSTAVRFWPAPI